MVVIQDENNEVKITANENKVIDDNLNIPLPLNYPDNQNVKIQNSNLEEIENVIIDENNIYENIDSLDKNTQEIDCEKENDFIDNQFSEEDEEKLEVNLDISGEKEIITHNYEFTNENSIIIGEEIDTENIYQLDFIDTQISDEELKSNEIDDIRGKDDFVEENIVKLDIEDTTSQKIANHNIGIIPVYEKIDNNQEKILEIELDSKNETGLEIQFSSLKLNKLPIKDSNLSKNTKLLEVISLGHSNIKVKDNVLYKNTIKIYSYEKFKILEIKNREFKLGLSIGLFDNTLREKDEYFYYEIYTSLNKNRLNSVIEIFKDIFSGEKIDFKVNKLLADVVFENRIQYHKFNILSDNLQKIDETLSKLGIKDNKYECLKDTSFYSYYLLNKYFNGEKEFESWINMNLELPEGFDVNRLENIKFFKLHRFNLYKQNIILRENIILKSNLSEKDIKDNRIITNRKTIKILLDDCTNQKEGEKC